MLCCWLYLVLYHLVLVVLIGPTWRLKRQHKHIVDPMSLLLYWFPKVSTWCLLHEIVGKKVTEMTLGGCGVWWETRTTLLCTLHQLSRETWWETSWVMYFTNSAADSIYMSYILIIPEKTRGAFQILFGKSLEIGGEVTCFEVDTDVSIYRTWQLWRDHDSIRFYCLFGCHNLIESSFS